MSASIKWYTPSLLPDWVRQLLYYSIIYVEISSYMSQNQTKKDLNLLETGTFDFNKKLFYTPVSKLFNSLTCRVAPVLIHKLK